MSYSPDEWCQGLGQVTNAAHLREYKLKPRRWWTSGTVIDQKNVFYSLEASWSVREEAE
jgi:hypothetical protein